MDDALGGGLVDPLDGEAQRLIGGLVVVLDRVQRGLGPGVHLGTDSPVAQAALLVLPVALYLGLDVGHTHLPVVLGRWLPGGCRSAWAVGPTVEASVAGPSSHRRAHPREPIESPMDLHRIRNTSIIAHIDHGKSTLADRMLELTGAVEAREMREQYLDSMDLERERGITIKLQSVRLNWRDHVINLIDTPGHVDFSYEVSRSLAACESVILVVDAAQGIEAQTLANCYQAMENNLDVVAAVNKIDLPAADPDRCAEEIERVLGIDAADILQISAKTGDGVAELLDAVLERTSPPQGSADAPLQALIFDSHFDQYRGVVSSVRVVNGVLAAHSQVRFMQAGTVHGADEVGVRTPANEVVDRLGPGETGYLIAGIKDVGEARSGETVTDEARPASEPLEGYSEPKPMVFSGLYPTEGDDFTNLRAALSKLRLNDAGFNYEPETSGALGFGFRCGFLGLLHMEIVRERLEREFDLSLISTAPSVEYRVTMTSGDVVAVSQPVRDAGCRPDLGCRRAHAGRRSDHAHRLHGHADGAVPVAPGRAGAHGVPVA